jgi:hypothetical protein
MELSARPGPDRSYRSLLRKPFLADELLRRVWGALENGGRAERRSPVPQPPASPPR